MTTSTLGFAAAAGLVAALNPCGFAMLPSYVTLVVLGSGTRSRPAAVARALGATLAMALGFLVVFAVFGLIIAPVAGEVQRYLPIATIVIGVALIGIGGWLLSGREITVMLPKPGHGAPTAHLGSMFGYGLAYALASLSCTIGPFLAVTGATFHAGSIGEGVLAYLAYGAGMALVVGVLATGVALAGAGFAGRARRLLPYVNRAGGGLLVLIGLYVGYYGIYSVRLNLGDGSPHDPVVRAAGTVQETLAAWIDDLGPLPLIFALLVIVLATVVLARRRHS
ncbi:MAG TPA: cytochrome c biogenesis protein CcdA [Amycolatopsis sp.]|nr:cytochrome c biogenesis protein CcdA [Amycolatopsis sp.]